VATIIIATFLNITKKEAQGFFNKLI